MKLSKIIVFECLALSTVFPALIFRLFGFKVVCLRCSSSLQNSTTEQLLHGIHIQILDYSQFDCFDAKQLDTSRGALAKRLYFEMITDERQLYNFEPLFGGKSDTKQKLQVAAIDMISRLLGQLPELITCAEYFQKSYDKVYIFSKSNHIMKQGLVSESQKIRNLHPSFFGYNDLIFRVFGLAFRSIAAVVKQCLTSFKKIDSRVVENSCGACPERFEVVYFPHQGVAYSNLFLKDYYYSVEEKSPFYPSNIFHVEYESRLDGETYQDITSYYETNVIPYCFLPEISIKDVFRSLDLYFNHLFKTKDKVRKCERLSISVHFLFFNVLVAYQKYYTSMARFEAARMALVGYDILFPKPLALALSALNIRTVAVQERFIATFMEDYNVLIDDYLVCGEIVSEKLSLRENSCVKTIVPIGPIRLDSLYGCLTLEEDSASKRDVQKVIVVYDYHSEKDVYANRSQPLVNWKANKAFYIDLIKLAIAMPEIKIVIRGKNDDWCSIPYFTDVYELVSNIPNLEINRDYSKYNISYKLLSTADLVIAKHTSIADEALAAGVPVLFYDFSPSFGKVVSAMFDYQNYPVFVYSYDQLHSRVDEAINHSNYMDEEQFKKMRKYYYGDFFDGKVKDRLHVELNRIYLESASQ